MPQLLIDGQEQQQLFAAMSTAVVPSPFLLDWVGVKWLLLVYEIEIVAMGVLFPDITEIQEQSQSCAWFQNVSSISGRNTEPVA
jgi:hypothetical protein